MKHLFVVNAVAGRGRALAIREQLCRYDGQLDYEIYETKGRRDATAFVRARCESDPEPMRFYACGGDGTLQEVASGLVGYPQASLAAYACGSGNDFVKCYGGRERFLDIDRLIRAEETPIDLIHLNDGHVAVNACHFGFDSAVAVVMDKVRHKKIIGGKNAYLTGVAHAFFTAMTTRCTVTVDGETLNEDGRLLLCTIANGQYVGGSYHCAPRSRNDDGLLDVCLVRPLPRIKLLTLIRYYKEGKHLDDPRLRDLVIWRRGRCVEVQSPDPDFACALDGEIIHNPHFQVTAAEREVRFAVPAEDTVSAVREPAQLSIGAKER